MQLAFDWRRLPRDVDAETLLLLMTELQALGPIGFRGPAAPRVPDHLTVIDEGIRTAQHISPGVRCRSNALIGDVLDITGEDLLFITSANTSSHRSRQAEAAHCEMDEIAREFGYRRDVVMIGHDDEAAIRRFYPHHLPCSTSILAFHRDVREDGRPALDPRAPGLARHRPDPRRGRPPRLRARDRALGARAPPGALAARRAAPGRIA